MSEIKVIEWKDVPGYEMYQVSNIGGLVRHKIHGIKKQQYSSDGYPMVKLWSQKTKKCPHLKIHTIVMMAFVGPRPLRMETGHIDGDKTNNDLSNLKYCTTKENAQDKLKHGSGPIGERSPKAKLSAKQVLEIRERVKIGHKGKSNTYALAKEYGVLPKHIYSIGMRRTWKHLA